MTVARDADSSNADRSVVDPRVRRVELLISHLLRVGVLMSLVLVVAGTVVTFARAPEFVTHADLLHGLTGTHASFPHDIASVVHGAAHLEGQAIVALGLLLLIATPVVRVAVSIVAFAYQRDRTYVVITSGVLALLLLSFALGRAGG